MALKPRFSKKLDQIGDDATDILNLTLTGFVVGANTPITATDTILSAFEKTQGQINAITGGSSIFVKADGTIPLTATWNVGNHDITNINMLALGVTTATAVIDVSGNFSSTAWTTNGIGLRWRASTYTDTTSTGTVADMNIHLISASTVAASSSTTYTNVYGFTVTTPLAGTNVTLTNAYAFRSNGSARFDSTIVGLGDINLFGGTRNIGTNDTNQLNLRTNGLTRINIGAGNGFIGIGSTLATSVIDITTNATVSAWTTNGIGIKYRGSTFTDTSS
jgi:hypothetical protein